MSLIPHSFFPRSSFNTDDWMQPFGSNVGTSGFAPPSTTLDLFDPFDELDQTMARNLQWLSRPEWLNVVPVQPKVPQKYRITLDCVGFNPKSIKTDVKGQIVTVSAREESKFENDFSVKEFKKVYTLPESAESDKLVSFMTGDGQLVVEVPLRESQAQLNVDLLPRVVDVPEGGKQVQMKFNLPESIRPEKVHINVKDRCLIVKAEDTQRKPDGVSKFHYYKRTTLPENTDFEGMKCNYDNHQVSVQAPLTADFNRFKPLVDHKSHPVKMIAGQQQQVGQQFGGAITGGRR